MVGGALVRLAVAASDVIEPATTEVLDAVRAELAPLPVTVTRPGLVAAALAMARVLDDPAQAPDHPATARSLGDMAPFGHWLVICGQALRGLARRSS